MVTTISNLAARTACDAINGLMDADAAPGTLVIYDGSRPATPDVAPTTQVALVTFELGDPVYEPAENVSNSGHATANPILPVPADETGTASWFRIFDGAGVAITDGTVTDTNGNGELKVSTTAIVEGVNVTVVSLVSFLPQSSAA